MFGNYLQIYSIVSSAIILSIGAINYTIDPLWYGKGNQLNGINITFNERLTKTNLYLNNGKKKHDCLIFGSSRTTLLNTYSLKKNNCFNYAFSAGTIEEFVKYAEYVKERGANPKKVYIGVDAFNFGADKKIQHNIKVAEPSPIYESYLFSLDALDLSIKTIRKKTRLPRFYDDEFKVKVFEDTPKYKPELIESKSNKKCNFSRISYYKKLQAVFPKAEFIAYVPPISVWKLYNSSYSNGILNCQLQGIHQVSRLFDKMYDFSYVSPVTTNIDNTYDGSHFYPQVNDNIAEILEGKQSDFGIRVDRMNLNEYQQFHKKQLKEFLDKQGKEELWRG